MFVIEGIQKNGQKKSLKLLDKSGSNENLYFPDYDNEYHAIAPAQSTGAQRRNT